MPLPHDIFQGRGVGGELTPFTLSLGYDDDDHSVSGPIDTTMDSRLATALASDSGWLSSTYGSSLFEYGNGYYTVEIAEDTIATITCKGASGGHCYDNTWDRGIGFGRSITGTFSLSAGDQLVIVCGSRGQNIGEADRNFSGGPFESENCGGTGGGASFVAKYSNGSLTPLVVAAGGSGVPRYLDLHNAFKQQATRYSFSAVPLYSDGTTDHASIRSVRDNAVNFAYTSSLYFGVGRTEAGTGGAGWTQSRPLTCEGNQYSAYSGSSSYAAQSLDAYAVGGYHEANGGFGGGGGHHFSNGYASGGGGYFGGFETVGDTDVMSSATEYAAYLACGNDTAQWELGPISYVDDSNSSWSDNGIHTTTYNGNQALVSSGDDTPINGRVDILFEEQFN